VPVHTQGSLLDGRYRVVRHLGSGGMASVLLCEDERLGRQVAVKRLHADSPVDVERRFKREAKLGASLNHPNLVSVFDTATDDEGVLIVMEYVEGEPLSRVLRRGPLRPEEAGRMICDVGDALDHAHAQGVVHRDVKPGNVLLREDGVTKLADLGIATAADDTRITRSGVVLGTAAYMAPEQLEGGDVGPAADIYALAAIAFEALSGLKPREGRTPIEIAHKVATEGAPDLRDAWPKAPVAAAQVLQRGMALDPQDRPSSAGELARELAAALEEQPTQTAPTRRFTGSEPVVAPVPTGAGATPPGEPPSTAGPMRRGRSGRRPSFTAIALALIFIALAVATIVGAVVSSGDDNGSSPRADRTTGEQKQPAGSKKAPKKKEKAKQDQAAPAPAESPPADDSQSSSGDSSSGAELNKQGFDLMNQGRYADAIPVLEQAVESFPKGTTDLNYAYALYNLGRSLRLAGQPDKAIPILKQRLKIPNQTETVRRELELAKQEAKQH
jgi:serine/threonine protein kinase